MCRFLNITKAFKPFVWSVNKQKAKSNPFRPNLCPGKSLTKQNSPGTCSSGCFGSPFPQPSLLFLSFCFFHSCLIMKLCLLIWKTTHIFSGTKTIFKKVMTHFLLSGLTESRGRLPSPVWSPCCQEMVGLCLLSEDRKRTHSRHRVLERDKTRDFCPRHLISSSCYFPERRAPWLAIN